METFMISAGWVLWGLGAWAVSGSIAMLRGGQTFNWATVAQSLLGGAACIAFLLVDVSKVHLLWIWPVAFVLGSLLGQSFGARPILRLYAGILLIGTGRIVD